MSARTGLPARGWGALVAAEARMVARDTSGLVVPLLLPPLILVMVGTTAPDLPPEVLGDRSVVEVVGLPIACATVLALVGMVNVPSFVATYRRSGVLRRLGVTPAGPAPVLLAQGIVGVAQVAAGIGVAFGVAAVAFGAGIPAAPWAALGGLVLATAAFFALGAAVAALAPTANAAIAAGVVLFFGTGMLGGMFGDPRALPGPLAGIGRVLPYGATAEVLGTAWRGVAPDPGAVAGLAVTVLVGAGVAVRFFRWT
ncbi:ABC transporter permease [Pseudonocardia spirodelae]|uniref:ABC transporter permease n=1 Tax=Pseudonocardia spirodelae TaxID=3133431 RepID=A0ABU8T7H9_9PSEU